ncbi:unnamed protein product [Periconia digitata]|uniref:Glycosyl transferase CAP10 domain-containing protein n=1 Tax=Periconia digitata TaxID=1303443 RepID=A0A9W4USL9_9PLEO|nr:unnamed protein product [Periconia digitata]
MGPSKRFPTTSPSSSALSLNFSLTSSPRRKSTMNSNKSIRNLGWPLLKALVCLFVLFEIGSFLLSARSDPHPVSSDKPASQAPEPKFLSDQEVIKSTPEDPADWAKSFHRYGLAEAQCTSEFSDLFKDIARAVEHRNTIGHVQPKDLDIGWKEEGAVRAMIYNQKLFILESKINDGFMISRALGTLQQIDRALKASPEPLPNIEFSFVVGDLPDTEHAHHTVWALSRLAVDEEMWLMPDFGYWSWPLDLVGNYEQIRTEIKANEVDWAQKIPKALWRGAVKTNPVRSKLLKATRGKKWADVQEVKWKNRTDVAAGSASSAMSMVDHCKHQFLIHTEGRSYSGRGKYLLNCESIIFMHKREWVEPHHSVLVSEGLNQNFVEVERDFSDMEAKIQELINNPERAKVIAHNSATTFRDRYLTPAAQACYWRHMIRAWAQVSFTPKPWVLINGEKKLRGVPFETYVVQALENTIKTCSVWKKMSLQC